MRYNNRKPQRNNHSSYRANAGGQSYVWRVRWWNMNVRYGADQFKAFRSKAQALIFQAKLKSNPNNYVADLEKIAG
jgi:hypothetical protein